MSDKRYPYTRLDYPDGRVGIIPPYHPNPLGAMFCAVVGEGARPSTVSAEEGGRLVAQRRAESAASSQPRAKTAA